MRKVFHIGLPKTGTTFLQKNVFPYLKDVNYFNCVEYPKSDFPVYLNPFYLEFKEGINLVSDERICGLGFVDLPYVSAINKLKRLKTCYPDAEIIFVRRSISTLVTSLYKQYVKHSYGTLDIGYWLLFELDMSILRMNDIERYLENNFKRVLILDYEELLLNQDDFIHQITEFIGVDFPDDYNRDTIYTSPSDGIINTILKINKSKIIPKKLKMILAYLYRRNND